MPTGEKIMVSMSIRLTRAEKARLDQAAGKVGLTATDFIRRATLKAMGDVDRVSVDPVILALLEAK